MMKKLFTIIICICAVTAQAQKPNNEALRKLQMAEFAITNLYVDKVDEDKLVEEAIIKMLAQLDPHSTYNNAEEVKKMNEPLQGNFEGIGVQFQMIEDTLLVIQPVSNGPSEKVGILAGDRIVAVNDSAIAGVKMSTEDIMSRLRGPKDSEVKLTIVRRGVDDQLYFTVKRDKIPILSLDASYMIQPKTGYIRINRFGATTAEEFAEALKSLQKKGMKDLILDLQGNGGGYLNAAIDLANEFLKQKELIVYTEGRAARRSDFFAKGTGNFKNGRLIILVDEYSASASEIVTGAIQDWDRGVVVGRRTFGKGLVCPILRRRYLASLSLSRCLWGYCGLERNGKGGKTFRYRVQLFSPKREDCPHQLCLQPLANILVHAEIGVAALVVELSHRKTGYVATEMLQDNFHSVRVALCRCHNDRIRNKGDFRAVGLFTIRPIHQRVPPSIVLDVQKSLSVCTVSCCATCRIAFQSQRRSCPQNSTEV